MTHLVDFAELARLLGTTTECIHELAHGGLPYSFTTSHGHCIHWSDRKVSKMANTILPPARLN
jgi:hypothetical protein